MTGDNRSLQTLGIAVPFGVENVRKFFPSGCPVGFADPVERGLIDGVVRMQTMPAFRQSDGGIRQIGGRTMRRTIHGSLVVADG